MTIELIQFDSLLADITVLVSPIGQMKVTDQETSLTALDHGKKISTALKRVDALRAQLVKPLNDTVKAINARAKDVERPLLGADAHIRSQLNVYAAEQVRIKADEQRRIEVARIKAEEDARSIAREEAQAMAEFGVGSEIEAKKQEQAAVKSVQKEFVAQARAVAQPAVKGTREHWMFEVVDTTQVPRSFLKIDEQSIRAAVMAGAREIPGVRIYSEQRVAL